MQAFLRNIWDFITNIFIGINSTITNNSSLGTLYTNWLDKNILSGDLINIGMTWRELFLFGATWFLTIFFIIFFVKLVFKVIGLICLR